MGNTPIYVVGEVDYREVDLDIPWIRKTNICLRYPQFTDTMPDNLSIDYKVPLKTEYFLIPSKDVINNCADGLELRLLDKTRAVMLSGHYNPWNGYHSMKVIKSEIVPITNNYAIK
jgi:hypothetical protein